MSTKPLYRSMVVQISPTRPQYVLELGVHKADAGRVCALEVGPFRREADARSFAADVRGASASALLDLPFAMAYDLPEDEIREQRYLIVGATLNVYSDADGTYRNIDLY